MRLTRAIGIALFVSAAAVTAAWADGPQAGTTTNSAQSRGGHLLYVASIRPKAHRTRLKLLRDGRRMRIATLPGEFGFPVVAQNGTSEGVSPDGSTLVLASPTGRFAVVEARTLHLRYVTGLGSAFTFDALSPHARTLYLIQHVTSRFSSRYYVRAYDLEQHRLVKEPIFDTREKWSLMSGMPVTRATSRSGRWVYTLYSRPGGKPFVHMLDSIHRKAVCVDLPWMSNQNRLFQMQLVLSRDERKLFLREGSRTVRTVDTRTFRVT